MVDLAGALPLRLDGGEGDRESERGFPLVRRGGERERDALSERPLPLFGGGDLESYDDDLSRFLAGPPRDRDSDASLFPPVRFGGGDLV